MIPVKLELYNFLAYRTPEPLDLTGIHLACLAGANGAGKSSLLDAITWVLWGKARAHSDNELIHGDEIEMQVKMHFSLEGHLYCVTRYRSRKGAGSSLLNLDIQDGEGWRTLNEPTIRATQERLTGLLRLDYPTFINSAFLVQGRADEFTKKTPAERKAILGEILGLDTWGAYEERTKHHLREIEERRLQTENQIQEIDNELTREVEYQRDLIDAQRALDVLQDQVHEAEMHYHELQDARRERDNVRVRISDFQGRTAQEQAELERVEAEQRQQSERLALLQETLATQADIEAGYEAWQEARQQERDMSARLLEQGSLLERQSDLREALTIARSALSADYSALQQRSADLERDIKSGGDQEATRDAQNKLENLQKREEECGAWRDQLAALREEQARWDAVLHSLQSEKENVTFQLGQIEAADEPICPLCGQNLSAEHRSELLARLEQQRNEKEAEWQAAFQRIDTAKREIARLAKDIKTAEGELRNLPPLREHLARLTERSTRAQQAQQDLDIVFVDLECLDAVLSSEDYAHEEKAQLAEVQAELAELGYDEAAHQAAHQRVETYGIYEARKADLDRAIEAVPQLEEQVANLIVRAEAWQQRLGESREALEKLEAEVDALDQQLVGFEQFEHQLADLHDQEGRARYNVGAAEQKINALGQQRRRRQELLDRQEQLAVEKSIYDDLRLSFGKDGIPAMIIEAAIPEIEVGANQILSRMTDGRMTVRFDTQREKVTGGTRETLDIKIADELGTRDYATFSGGEAFRVNFAIRLALSRLLARRAGAQLRTLILDEGFGTQDAQGRERLVQAINVIQDDFDLILVITHIDELKEAFPARIEVTKTPAGSLIELA
jgi:exonuclease SbcC